MKKLLFLSFVLIASIRAQEAAKGDPWPVKVYRYPDEGLIGGFISSEQGQLRAPALPPVDAKDEAITDFIRRSHFAFRARLIEEGITLPAGSLAAIDPVNQTLAVRTTPAMHERISAIATRLERSLAKNVHFSVEIIEADAAAVREAMRKAVKADHRPVWEALDAQVSASKAVVITSQRLETKGGSRATVQSGEERFFTSEMTFDEKTRSTTAMESRRAGTILEIEPTIGADGVTLEVNVSLEHHHGQPVDRWDVINTSDGKSVESPLVDFQVAHPVTGFTMLSGMTKMLGVWQPASAPKGEKLQIAFLTAHVVTLLPALDTRIEQLLRSHGERVEKTPAAPPAEPQGGPKGIITRTFFVSEDLLTMDDPPSAGAADPFASAPAGAASEPKLTVRLTAMDILKSKGIPFPEGSAATYTASTGELLVRNTAPNMKLIEELITSRRHYAARTLTSTLHLIEADAATLRQLERQTAAITDHGAAWKAVEQAVSEGRARILESVFSEGKSGLRSTFVNGSEYMYATGTDGAAGTVTNHNSTDPKEGENKTTQISQLSVVEDAPPSFSSTVEMRTVGLEFEYEPVVSPDGRLIDLTYRLAYDYAPPTLVATPAPKDDKLIRPLDRRHRFHQANLTTGTTMAHGTHRLLGIWKPEGKPEFDNGAKLQAAFLRIDIVPVER
jgi:hypothetical protein